MALFCNIAILFWLKKYFLNTGLPKKNYTLYFKILFMRPYLFSVFIMLFSQFSLTASYVLSKSLLFNLPTPVVVFFRFLIGPLLLLPFFLSRKIKLQLENPILLIVRFLTGVSSLVFYFLSIKYGEIGRSTLISQLTVVWTLLMSTFLFKEKPSLLTKLAIPIAFLGLVLVLSPNLNFSIHKSDVFALINSFLVSISWLNTKQLRKTHNSFSIVFTFYGLAAISSSFFVPFQSLPVYSVVLLMLVGLFSFLGQYGMTVAFKNVSASVGSSFNLISVPLTYLAGTLFFQEKLSFIAGMGIFLVLSSLFIISKYQ